MSDKKSYIINFGNILNEMKDKDVKIILGIGNTICIEDNKSNLYEIETYYHGSYLEKFIKSESIVTFNQLEKKQSEHLKKLYKNEIEIFDYDKMKDFYENVVLVDYPELRKNENRMFESYKKRFLEECKADNDNKIRFISIEYLCSFPKIDPVEMAKGLISSGCEILFDDTSISQVENDKKRNKVYSSCNHIEKQKNKETEIEEEEDCL